MESESEVVVGNGPGKEQTVRVAPVIHGLDDFLAGGGGELAEIELEPWPWAA